MRYIRKPPIEDEIRSDRLEASGWQLLTVPCGSCLHTLLTVIMGVCSMGLNTFYLWWLFDYNISTDFTKGSLELGKAQVNLIYDVEQIVTLGEYVFLIFVAAWITLLLHEWIHVCCMPKGIFSTKTYWGFHGILGFVYTEEELSKRRYICISVMPLLLLSYGIPAIWCMCWQMNWLIALLSILNAGGACSDILNLLYVCWKVPKNGKVVSNGTVSFYKVDNRR